MTPLELIIVCGRSYAGKSTVSARLAAERQCLHLSFDDPLEEWSLDPRTMTLDQWGEVYRATYERLDRALASGRSVVLDGANKRQDRDIARQIATRHGARVSLIHVTASEQEAWRRWKENGEQPQRAQLARETMELSLALFEAPAVEEQAIELSL